MKRFSSVVLFFQGINTFSVSFTTSRHPSLSLFEIHHTTRVAFCFLLPPLVALTYESTMAGVKDLIVQVGSKAFSWGRTPAQVYISGGISKRKWVWLCKLLPSCCTAGHFNSSRREKKYEAVLSNISFPDSQASPVSRALNNHLFTILSGVFDLDCCSYNHFCGKEREHVLRTDCLNAV